LRTQDELFERIGLGERVAPFIARRLLPADAEAAAEGVPARWPSPARKDSSSLRPVLLPDSERPDPRQPFEWPRRRDPSRGMRQLAVVPQASREMDSGDLAGRHRPALPRRDPGRRHQPHGRARSVASAIAGTQTNIDRVSVVERDLDTSTLIFECSCTTASNSRASYGQCAPCPKS
jgi:hypothetical protein